MAPKRRLSILFFVRFFATLLLVLWDLEGKAQEAKVDVNLTPFFEDGGSWLEGVRGAFVTSFVAPAPFAHPVFKKGMGKNTLVGDGESSVSCYVARFVHKQSAPLTHKVLKAVSRYGTPLSLDLRSSRGLSKEPSRDLPSPTQLVRKSRDSPPPLSPLSHFIARQGRPAMSSRRQTSLPSSPTRKTLGPKSEGRFFVQTRRGPLEVSRSAVDISKTPRVQRIKTSPSHGDLSSTAHSSPPVPSVLPLPSDAEGGRVRSRSFSGERRHRPDSLLLPPPRKRSSSFSQAQSRSEPYSTLRSPEESLSNTPVKKPRVVGRFDKSQQRPFLSGSPTALNVTRVPPERLSLAEGLPSGSESSVPSGGGSRPRLTGARRFRATVRAVVMVRRWAKSARARVANRGRTHGP